MMSRGINPYLFGPGMIGVNAFSGLVDKLWANVTSPYGPLFLWIAGVNATVVRHNELLAVVGFRLLAFIGVLLIAFFVPRLARCLWSRPFGRLRARRLEPARAAAPRGGRAQRPR